MSFSNLFGTPHFHAVCLVLVSAAAIEALIAIWAATSRVHWFWRAIAVWAAVTMLLPIRAYQPALLFAVTSPLTIILIRAISSCRRSAWERTPGRSASLVPSTRRFYFTLRDLLLATALVGLALASLLHLAPRLGEVHIAEFALTAIIQIAVPTFVWAALLTSRRYLSYAALVTVIAGVSLAVHFITPVFVGILYDWALVGVLFEGGRWRFYDVQVAATAGSELALLLLAALRLAPLITALRVPLLTPTLGLQTHTWTLRVLLLLPAAGW